MTCGWSAACVADDAADALQMRGDLLPVARIALAAAVEPELQQVHHHDRLVGGPSGECGELFGRRLQGWAHPLILRSLTNRRKQPLPSGSSNSSLCASNPKGEEKSSGATSITSGIQRVTDDRQPQRRHVHPQLMGAAGAWRQPVQAVAEMLDQRLGIRLAGFLDGL